MEMKPDEPDTTGLKELNERAIELADRGELEAAEAVFRRAAEAGSLASLFNLGRLLGLTGRPGEAFDAEEAFKRGAAEGDPLAARNYGEALLDWGRSEEGEVAFEVAIQGGDELAAELLADLRNG